MPDTGSYYAASAGDTSFTIAVNLPSQASTFNGSGFLANTASAGTYTADAGQKTQFTISTKYNKGGTNLQGSASFTVISNGRTYQIQATSLTSLGVTDTVQGGYGGLLGVATITDITNPLSPVLVEANDALTIAFHDNGSPGTSDTLGVSLYNGQVLRYSSKWNGTATVDQNLGGGNLSAK